MPSNKKKRNAKKRAANKTGAQAKIKANEEAKYEGKVDFEVEERLKRIYARCTTAIAEELEERFKSTWPPVKPLEALPAKKQYPKAYEKVSNTFNAGLDLTRKQTGITGLSRWHVVLEKMLDALEIISAEGNEDVQSLFLERVGGDHRQLLCSILCTISQTFQKASDWKHLKAWAKVSIAADPTYFKGYCQLATAEIHGSYNWKLGLELTKKGITMGNRRGNITENSPIPARIDTLEAILNPPSKAEGQRLKREYIYDNRGTAVRYWQDMNIPQPAKICALCHATGEHKCAKCKTVYYCGRQCQILDHPEHKMVCVEPSEENKIEVIENPHFSPEELEMDEEHWETMKRHAKRQGTSILLGSCNNCHATSVKRALMEGTNVNEKCNKFLETPIMVAALRREPGEAVDIVKTLIMHGACPNVVRGDGSHLLAICRSRAAWINDREPSMVNSMFQLMAMCRGGVEKAEREESAELVALVASAIRQHKLCKLCKARKRMKGYDVHLKISENLTDDFIENYESKI